jgi:hypothetical protein
MAEGQVPPPVSEQAERIQSRPYEDFARLPEDEVRRDALSTRDMRVDNRIVWPPVIVTVGFVVAFLVFIVQHWLALVIGFGLILVGTVMSLASHRGPRGVGPVKPVRSR